MRLTLQGCMKLRTPTSPCGTSSCSPTSTEAVEQLGKALKLSNWWSLKVSSYSRRAHWPQISWLRWGLCLGKHGLWDAAVPRGLFTEFHESPRPSVVPDHHKGIIWVKEIIKTSEGMVVCFFVSKPKKVCTGKQKYHLQTIEENIYDSKGPGQDTLKNRPDKTTDCFYPSASSTITALQWL